MSVPADTAAEFTYGPNDYFAFVESRDRLARGLGSVVPEKDPLGGVLIAREQLKLGRPNQLVWLDCIEARYFMSLPWRDEPCPIGDAAAASTRRARLQTVDRRKLRTGPLLINDQGAERPVALELARAAWHRIALEDATGTPFTVAQDFDMEVGTREQRFLRYVGRCAEHEMMSLRNVFSLNFLPDGQLGRRGGNAPRTPPQSPAPRPTYQPMVIEQAVPESIPTPMYQYAER